LKINFNFLCCTHQGHRDFLTTLHICNHYKNLHNLPPICTVSNFSHCFISFIYSSFSITTFHTERRRYVTALCYPLNLQAGEHCRLPARYVRTKLRYYTVVLVRPSYFSLSLSHFRLQRGEIQAHRGNTTYNSPTFLLCQLLRAANRKNFSWEAFGFSASQALHSEVCSRIEQRTSV
jgi:hypothetical protein